MRKSESVGGREGIFILTDIHMSGFAIVTASSCGTAAGRCGACAMAFQPRSEIICGDKSCAGSQSATSLLVRFGYRQSQLQIGGNDVQRRMLEAWPNQD